MPIKSFLPIQGNADIGDGLIWRAADDRNYFLVRANPLEQNIRVYRVVIEHLLQTFDRTISVKQWHTLRVTHEDCRVTIFYDDKQVFDLFDKTFHDGMIGLWTTSDTATYFDDFSCNTLPDRNRDTSHSCFSTCTVTRHHRSADTFGALC